MPELLSIPTPIEIGKVTRNYGINLSTSWCRQGAVHWASGAILAVVRTKKCWSQNKHHRRLSLAAFLLSTALLPHAVLAASGDNDQQFTNPTLLKNLSLEELSNIEVTTPSKEPASALRANVALFIITGDDIRRSGVTTIPDALRLAPGVEVARIDGSKWSIGIRGFGTRLSRSVLVLIDGRSVYTPLFAGTYWEVQDTLLQDIDRIEIIRGPGGTIWGPNAVNGVINIITKTSKDTQGTYAGVRTGNDEQGYVSGRYGGTAGGVNYRVYAKAFTRGPQYHFNKDNFDDWRGAQSGFRTDWSSGSRDSFSVQGDVYTQEDGQRVTLGTYTPPSQVTFDQNASATGGNILARWTRKLNSDNNFQLQAYYDRTNRYEPNLGERRDTFDVDFVQKTRHGIHQLVYGAGARISPARFLRVSSGLVFEPANRTDYLATGFFQDDINLWNDKVVLTLGAKLLRTNYTDFAVQPSARLLWAPTKRQSFWAAFTHAVRTPSRAEHDFYLSSYIGTASDGSPRYARFNANPDFAPEQMNGYEAGYRAVLRKNVSLDISTFWNHYHNLLSQDVLTINVPETTLPFPDPAPTAPHTIITAQFQNDFYGFTTGTEIAPEWRPTEYWRLRASYSFLNMNLSRAASRLIPVVSPSATTGASPRHQATAQASLDLPGPLQFDLVYRYVAALPAFAISGYHTADARLGWRSKSGFDLSLIGRNLFQPHHLEYAGDPSGTVGIRRSVFLSLAFSR